MNPYKTLGVKKNASREEIRTAYIAKAKELHPDKENGDEVAFVEAKRAYDVLSDPILRKSYDDTGHMPGSEKSKLMQDAIANLSNIFSDILRSIPIERLAGENVISLVRQIVSVAKDEQQSALARLENERSKFVSARAVYLKRLTRKSKKGDQNIFIAAIDLTISQIDIQIYPTKMKIECVVLALKILDDYEFEVENDIPQTMMQPHFLHMRMFTSTTG